MYSQICNLRQTHSVKFLFLFSILLILLTFPNIYGQGVTLHTQSVIVYENPNFGGRSKTFGIGNYRFFNANDFNDVVSSIKVPNGLAAIIYEHADTGGGYGISVDLLEDCADLSKYNLNNKVVVSQGISR